VTAWPPPAIIEPYPEPPEGRMARMAARIRGSTWLSAAVRGTVIAVVIVVLAVVGRLARAPAAIASPIVDAGPLALPVAISPASSPLPAPTPPAPPTPEVSAQSRTRASAEDPVYLNQAGPEELRRLPGVGVKRADAIIALRQRIGRFQRVEDLLR